MPTPFSENKTVQARILAYAKEIGWKVLSREESKGRCGVYPDVLPKDRLLFFYTRLHELMTAKTCVNLHNILTA